MDEKSQPIVIKRVNKVVAGHHGGSWKVAFADFMTAMFAMFLVLWLVTAMDEPQKAGIAGYFRDPSAVQGSGGDSSSLIQFEASESLIDFDGGSQSILDFGDRPTPPTSQELDEELRQRELEQMAELQQSLEEAIESSQALEPFKDQLLLDITPEGLRIQLVDKRNRTMFPLGSAVLKQYAAEILNQLADVVNRVPNKISIAGHTDATPFAAHREEDYDNWELSADRANAARRALLDGGMRPDRIAQVVGLADTVLFDKENRFNPINRRISIIILNTQAEEAISRREGAYQ